MGSSDVVEGLDINKAMWSAVLSAIICFGIAFLVPFFGFKAWIGAAIIAALNVVFLVIVLFRFSLYLCDRCDDFIEQLSKLSPYLAPSLLALVASLLVTWSNWRGMVLATIILLLLEWCFVNFTLLDRSQRRRLYFLSLVTGVIIFLVLKYTPSLH